MSKLDDKYIKTLEKLIDLLNKENKSLKNLVKHDQACIDALEALLRFREYVSNNDLQLRQSNQA